MEPLARPPQSKKPSPSDWFSQYQQSYHKLQKCHFWQWRQQQKLTEHLTYLVQQIEQHYGEHYQVYRHHDRLLLIPTAEKHVLPNWYDWLVKLIFPSYYKNKQQTFASIINNQQHYQNHILHQKKTNQDSKKETPEALTETQKQVDDALKQGEKTMQQQCQQALSISQKVLTAFSIEPEAMPQHFLQRS